MRSSSSAASATSFKLFSAHCKDRRKKASFMIHGVQSLPENQSGYLRFQLPNSLLLGRNRINPVVSSSSSSYSSNLQVELDLVNGDESHLQLPDQDYDSRMIHVILQLQRQCNFGEQFFIVGDHRRLGSWEPFDAVPMIWSEGHVWTAELDLPVGELIQFKFILKEITGKFVWQPGPNRVLKTWETSKAINVSGDWENAAFQEIIEPNEVMINGNTQQQLGMDTYCNGFPPFNGKAMPTVEENVNGYGRSELGDKSLMVMNILETEPEIPVSVNALNPCLIEPTEDVTAKEERVIEISELDQKQEDEEEEEQEKKEVTDEMISNKENALIKHPNVGFLENNFKWWAQQTLLRVLTKLGVL